MDKDSDSPILLDNRPDNNCFADSNEALQCNAFVSRYIVSAHPFLQYYKGYLYTLESRADLDNHFVFEVIKRNADGSDRKVIRSLSHGEVTNVAIHRDYLYYSAKDFDKDNHVTYRLLRFPLNKRISKPEMLYEGKYQMGNINTMLPYGSQVYLTEWTDRGYQTIRYDLNSKTAKVIWSKADGGNPALAAIRGDKLYFSYYYPAVKSGTSDLYDKRALVFYSSNLDGSDIKATDIPMSSMISNLYMDHQYTYVRPVWFQLSRVKDVLNEMNVYQNLKFVGSVDTSTFLLNHFVIAGDDKKMFVFETNMDAQKSIIYQLDKTKFGVGNFRFKKLLESPIISY